MCGVAIGELSAYGLVCFPVRTGHQHWHDSQRRIMPSEIKKPHQTQTNSFSILYIPGSMHHPSKMVKQEMNLKREISYGYEN